MGIVEGEPRGAGDGGLPLRDLLLGDVGIALRDVDDDAVVALAVGLHVEDAIGAEAFAQNVDRLVLIGLEQLPLQLPLVEL